MKKLIILCFIVMMVSCKNEKNDELNPFNEGKHIGFSFSYVDEIGNDLLSTENPNAFNLQSFRLYYLINGVKVEVVDKNLVQKRNMIIQCGSDLPTCVLLINLSDYNILEIPGTNFSDTIRIEDNGHIIRYNSEVVWDASTDEYRIPIATIVK